MLPSNTVLLISGGIDSFCQWRLLGKPRAIYFAIGHRYQDRELEKIRGHCRKTYTNLEHHAENEKRFGKKTLWYKIKRLFKSK